MSFSADNSDANHKTRERQDSTEPETVTPLVELAAGDGYRWATLYAADLDPPTTFPPDAAD